MTFHRFCVEFWTFFCRFGHVLASIFDAIWCDVLLDCLSAFLASPARHDMQDDPGSTICFQPYRFAPLFLVTRADRFWTGDRWRSALARCIFATLLSPVSIAINHFPIVITISLSLYLSLPQHFTRSLKQTPPSEFIFI